MMLSPLSDIFTQSRIGNEGSGEATQTIETLKFLLGLVLRPVVVNTDAVTLQSLTQSLSGRASVGTLSPEDRFYTTVQLKTCRDELVRRGSWAAQVDSSTIAPIHAAAITGLGALLDPGVGARMREIVSGLAPIANLDSEVAAVQFVAQVLEEFPDSTPEAALEITIYCAAVLSRSPILAVSQTGSMLQETVFGFSRHAGFTSDWGSRAVDMPAADVVEMLLAAAEARAYLRSVPNFLGLEREVGRWRGTHPSQIPNSDWILSAADALDQVQARGGVPAPLFLPIDIQDRRSFLEDLYSTGQIGIPRHNLGLRLFPGNRATSSFLGAHPSHLGLMVAVFVPGPRIHTLRTPAEALALLSRPVTDQPHLVREVLVEAGVWGIDVRTRSQSNDSLREFILTRVETGTMAFVAESLPHPDTEYVQLDRQGRVPDRVNN